MMTAEDQDWMDLAACSGRENLFFPQGRDKFDLRRVRQVCGSCLVRESCLKLGLRLLKAQIPISYGVWGGHTIPELQRLARRKKA